MNENDSTHPHSFGFSPHLISLLFCFVLFFAAAAAAALYKL